MNCPNCGDEHENKDSWYCPKCENRLQSIGLKTDKKDLEKMNGHD